MKCFPLLVVAAFAISGCATSVQDGCGTFVSSQGEYGLDFMDGKEGTLSPSMILGVVTKSVIDGSKPYAYKAYKAGCAGNNLFHMKSSAFPVERLHDPIKELATEIAARHNPPQPIDNIVIMYVGQGHTKKVRLLPGWLAPIPYELESKPATVVYYTTADHWSGPAPADQPWVKVK